MLKLILNINFIFIFIGQPGTPGLPGSVYQPSYQKPTLYPGSSYPGSQGKQFKLI